MKTRNEPHRWAIIWAMAAVLLIIWTTALGERPAIAGDLLERESTRLQAADPVVTGDDLVRLEDSLQWNGRDPIQLPDSLSVTDLLPARC